MDVFKILAAAKRLLDAGRARDWPAAIRAVAELLDMAADLFGPKPMRAAARNKIFRDAQKVGDPELDELVADLEAIAPPDAPVVAAAGDGEPDPVELDPATIAILIQLGLAVARKLIEWIRKRREPKPAA